MNKENKNRIEENTEKKNVWQRFKEKHPSSTQFIVFFIICNGITVLQLLLMPIFRSLFETTALQDMTFQMFQVGSNLDGSPFYIFNYTAGKILPDGSGGGLAYFLAVQITLAIAQVLNFFVQRNVTFKHKGSVLKAAMWYVLAYVAITFVAGAAQGIYKAPIYSFLMGVWGNFGESVADVTTMIINSAISFWVFFPIFKIIFKNKEVAEK